MDSADGRTYLYLEKEVYYCRETLASLEARLPALPLPGSAKAVWSTPSFLQSVRPLYNHRLEATLQNGEKLVITRNYIEPLKGKAERSKCMKNFLTVRVPSTCICFTLLLLANAILNLLSGIDTEGYDFTVLVLFLIILLCQGWILPWIMLNSGHGSSTALQSP